MLSKSQLKFIRSLKVKKYRYKERTFLVEGPKLIQELIETGGAIQQIFALSSWIQANKQQITQYSLKVQEITDKELAKISNLKTPNQVIACVPMKDSTIEPATLNTNVSLVLDDIRDPGNLGTIIRIAAWFNIPYVFCSFTSVDVYNPKVIQSTMGSFFHTKIIYINLLELFKTYDHLSIYGTSMKGQSIFETTIPNGSFIVIGNEAQGMENQIAEKCHHILSIPKYGQAESLNAAVATGIICACIKQNMGS